MKRINVLGKVLLITIIGTLIYGFSIDNMLPQKVKEAFTKKFPTVEKIKWEKDANSEWEAKFKIDGTQYSATFLEDGTWQETEQVIRKNGIPENVKTTLKTEFSDFKIDKIELSETQEGFRYEFDLKKRKNGKKVVIDINGIVVKYEIEDYEVDN